MLQFWGDPHFCALPPLLQVEVMEGELQCPDSGRRFPITGGVPNLLLPEGDA